MVALAPSPTVATIPPEVSFADALARGLKDRAGDDPLALASTTVLLPTRRACRTLHEAFLRLSDGAALLLPRMLPLGDLDADELLMGGEDALAAAGLGDPSKPLQLPPTISGVRRQFVLTQLIQKFGEVAPGAGVPTVDQAARLAEELGRLLDQVETEGLEFARLKELAPEQYAEHWQITLDFLKIVTDWWPDWLDQEGAIGPAERRRRLMQAQARAWADDPPDRPIIAAGSTGSIPATAELLRTIAHIPKGEVVLPGLDRRADAESWAAVTEDPTHPQHNLARLLASFGIDRDQVRDWPVDRPTQAAPLSRNAVVNEALKPASTTPEWRNLALDGGAEGLRQALADVRLVAAPGPVEEATSIALLLRQALEVPGKTAALVTPDRALARRVAAELRRFDLAIDDSAGVPMADTAPGTFLRLTAQMLGEKLAPVPLLSALKHPLAAGGEDPGAFKARVRELEERVLRGVRPAEGFDGLRAQLGDQPVDRRLAPWLDRLQEMAADALAAMRDSSVDLAQVVEAHMRFAETLADSDQEPGAARLWAGEAGESAADFAAELARHADAAPTIDGRRYPALLDGLMAGQVVRPRYGGHPRLAILGPLEARLQRADLTILGGLNEGTWPAETDPGPWMSRPMRDDFGLPPVERRIGLMAHDFTQAFAAPEVVLTRATRIEGTPTVPSRWLLRLEALQAAYGVKGLLTPDPRWVQWAKALDDPGPPRPCIPPAPTPPRAARPARLSVTAVETWMRDPYDLYARYVLRLRALEPLDQDPGAAEHGTLIHAVLEAFARDADTHGLPDDVAAGLRRIGVQKFDELKVRPGMRAFWWPRFERIADWLAERERTRRADGRRVLAERKGEIPVEGKQASLTLSAKADRIELLPDGRLAVIDYKTGTPPSEKQVALGFAPQLPLEAAIAAHGGFPDVAAAGAGELAYWRLTGGREAGQELTLKRTDPDELAAAALDGLTALIDRFADPDQPYHARPRPGFAPRYTDYDHLARVQEWSAGIGGED
ncbi:double-strand break repair protein AddB [Rhodovibrio salinarum]|uniref:Double-strand break repair protein AddB n=1 Tax=Rhodovibrio salinarum TaxID=1087 RepID=A0A934V2D3_9PROT|nr:double-strand break repair protein AddB [Rhodovibrio salinarum]MBK1699313.1 double-strand break repair protein AddB [Rhodovibrio salinarum]